MEGEEVEPFVVVALAPNKPKEKTGLEFKKGQLITVERVNKEAATMFGFYGKKEGWFADYFVKKENGVPEQRKGKPKPAPVKKEAAPPQPSKKEIQEQKKAEKAAQLEQAKKERADKKEAAKKQKATKKEPGSKKGSKAKKGNEEPTEKVPAIIECTVAYLEHPDRLKLEGLFRVSGSLTDVKMIKDQFLKGKKVDLDKVADPHTVAGVLKIFFRESKDPLLTFELYDCWVAAVATKEVWDRVKSVRQVIDMLPPVNKRILGRLMGLLALVAKYEKDNKMSVNNIAIVFAPTLLRPPGDQIDIAIQDSSYANHLIKFMIEEYETLFAEAAPVTGPSPTLQQGRPASVTAPVAPNPAQQLPGESDEAFDKRLRRGSLLLARGSFIGGMNSFQELEEKMNQEEDESSDVSIDLSSEDIDGDSDESDSADDEMSMEEMMNKILEGHVNEVDEYLSKLDPDTAAATKKDLLDRIDQLMQSDDFKD